MIPVILSGGSGTRLWPVSRAKYPKQFCELFEDSLQNLTLRRVSALGAPMIITSIVLRDLTLKKLKDSGFSGAPVIFEPFGRNTAPAIAVLCRWMELQNKANEIVGVFPADHLVEKEDAFLSALKLAELCAAEGKVVTLGLKPTHPETGYGYIQTQKTPIKHGEKHTAFEVIRFHEKPNLESAKNFLSAGSYWWNAGIFVFPVPLMIALFQKYQPQIWGAVKELKADLSNIAAIYEQMPNISIDYAIMEKLTGAELQCVPCNPGWSDVGSWDAVADVYEKSGREKTAVVEVDSKNNFVLPHNGKRYSFVGVDDVVVVDTADALLIAKKGSTQEVKTVVDRLKNEKSQLIQEHTFEERPWGRFDILRDSSYYKSKVIGVAAGAQISYQSHAKREEHWIIVKGVGEVVLNDEVIPVKYGSYVKIPLGAKHRIRNTGTEELQFIEVQLGQYFGEDDITRYQDDYKRL
jgi:mannose-1-phosphate guanylyltransferase/mannose-6-phosphate isomerase